MTTVGHPQVAQYPHALAAPDQSVRTLVEAVAAPLVSAGRPPTAPASTTTTCFPARAAVAAVNPASPAPITTTATSSRSPRTNDAAAHAPVTSLGMPGVSGERGVKVSTTASQCRRFHGVILALPRAGPGNHLLRGSSAGLRYSRPSGPMADTWVTYSPDFAQWK